MNIQKTYNLGLDDNNNIVIDSKHASVSHNHASITVDGDRWILTDNQSTNGTYVEENGFFRRYDKVAITPCTWIRLGVEGHRGYYFKARRILKPNDYSEDFAELYEFYQEYDETKAKFEARRRLAKYVGPVLSLVCLGLSFIIPSIKNDPLKLRFFIVAPGVCIPFITDFLLNGYERRMKELQREFICPKCRRTLGKDDIISRSHIFCHAQ